MMKTVNKVKSLDDSLPIKISLLSGKMTDRKTPVESKVYETLTSFFDNLATKTIEKFEILATK